MSSRYVVKKGDSVFALDCLITDELQAEGIVNEICHQVNILRKKRGLYLTERIELFFDSDDDVVIKAICSAEKRILSETQASKLHIIPLDRTLEYQRYNLKMFKANVLPPEEIPFSLDVGMRRGLYAKHFSGKVG